MRTIVGNEEDRAVDVWVETLVTIAGLMITGRELAEGQAASGGQQLLRPGVL
jgi:hypothetical protein